MVGNHRLWWKTLYEFAYFIINNELYRFKTKIKNSRKLLCEHHILNCNSN